MTASSTVRGSGATPVGPRAIVLNESPSATPSGSYSAVNSNGVTVNIIGIGVGFVGGALCLITLTLLTRLAIARRRAREAGRPLPHLWDIIFDSSMSGRAAIGRSMGGWDYGMDLWGGRVGLWAGVGSGEELGKRPEMKEVEIGFDDPAAGSSVNEWKPTSAYLHPSTIPILPAPTPTPSLELQPGSHLSTAFLILLPNPDRPYTDPSSPPPQPPKAGQAKTEVHHVEDVSLPHPPTPPRKASLRGPDLYPPSQTVEDPEDGEEEGDLPDFVLGVLSFSVTSDDPSVQPRQDEEMGKIGTAVDLSTESRGMEQKRKPTDGLTRNFWAR